MSDSRPVEEPDEKADVDAGVKQYLAKGFFAKLVMVAMLFLSAGRVDWVMGWLLVGVYVGWDIIVALLLIPRSPGLLAERSRMQEGAQRWDVVLTGVAASLLPMITWIAAGLDMRFGWTSPFSPAVRLVAFLIVILGFALVTWAMVSNEFFSALVRIQKKRGHRVASGGPYQYIRHPDYVGAVMFQLASPIMLGSLWALIPSGLSALLYVIRIALEDKTLQEELDGYTVYVQRVRYRMLPGLW